MRAPLAPSGWPSAIAPPLTFVLRRVELQVAHAGERLRGKGFVDLDQIEIARRASRRAAQRLARRRNRAEAHDVGRDAGRRARDDARQRLSSPSARAVCASHEQQRRGAVVDAGRVSGRHRAVAL